MDSLDVDLLEVSTGSIRGHCEGKMNRGLLRVPHCGMEVALVIYDETGSELLQATFLPDETTKKFTESLQPPLD
jgi:hypothetical protein